ncbi:MAG: hypothetical protein HYY40_05870 [Bacteroidetes bacterium]|nr:hypothetical protein [Bacteroidota bacterium]
MEKEIIHKELDLIQGLITRMASNSFEVKKWLIGILTAIVVFKYDELLGGNGQLIWLLLVPVFCFWYLDAFFLSTEKLYREMYKWVVKYRSQTGKYLYDLNSMSREFPDGNTEHLINEKNNVWNVMFSKTIWPFYAVPVFFIIAYAVLQYFSNCPHACCGY